MNKFIKRNLFAIIFLLVILVAVFLRFCQLGINPPSLTWDEASIGYNAYSILKTGADEYGIKFPLSIRSFDDYKPPLYTYLTVPFVGLFGLNEFSVRMPSAIIGVFFIVAIYFLVKEFLQKWDKKYRELTALASAFFLTISPWHLQFSRAAFEGNIGLFFLILGILLFFRGLRNGRLLIASSLSFILSLYSYHSFRLLIPFFLFFLTLFFWRELFKNRLSSIAGFSLLILFAVPIYFGFISKQDSSSRLSMVSIFSDPKIYDTSIKRIEYDKDRNDQIGTLFHNRRIEWGLAIAKGYLDHFNPDFLFLHGDGGVQHHAVDMGMLYLWDLPFILVGLYSLLNRRDRFMSILLLLFLLAPLPASITTGTPHPVRAIAMMPELHIFAAVGVVIVIAKLLQLRHFFYKRCLVGVIVLALIANVMYYLHQYYVHTPIEYGYFWQYGNKEAVEYARQHENEYKKIIMTYKIDQPYIYYLFYNKIDPLWYQKNVEKGNIGRFERKIGKYEFRYIDFDKDSREKDVLLIGVPDEIPEGAKVMKEIRYLDGRVAYRIAKT